MEVVPMMATIAMLLTSLLFLGPLGWGIWWDRKRAETDGIKAEIGAAINHRFRGESFLSVLVTPRFLGRAGRIVLSVPWGHEWLIEAAWRDVVGRVPRGYDLVVKAGDASSPRSRTEAGARELPRAA